LRYTLKQWGRHPSNLDKSVCGRVPIRFNRDESYISEVHQVMPMHGYTRMFDNMLDHSLIEVRLDTEYEQVRRSIQPRVGTVYSGAIDEYFEYRLGELPWRSLKFEFELYRQKFKQDCVQIIYPDQHEYTRSVEIKHVTGQEHEHTVVCYEYPQSKGEPYYPVLTPSSQKLYAAYSELARKERRDKRVYIGGRLGAFTYINSDQAIKRAIGLFEKIKNDFLNR